MKSNKMFFVWIFLCIGILASDFVLNKKNEITENQSISQEENITEVDINTSVDSVTDKIISISDITTDMEGKKVEIQATIVDIKNNNQHLFVTVKDNSGSILVPIFSDKDIDKTNIKEGLTYKICGYVDIYNGELEVIPQNQDDMTLISEETKVNDEISISKENIGKEVSISCKVLSTYNHPNGHIFLNVLTSNNEEISVPLFNTLGYENVINTGDEIKIKGKISEYNDKLQVIPNTANDITITSTSSEKSDEVKLISISDINETLRGQVVQVRGVPVDIVEKNGHVYFYLSENQNKIKAVLFKADSNEVLGRKDKLKEYSNLKKQVRVLGTIDVYNGELEIIIDKVFNQD